MVKQAKDFMESTSEARQRETSELPVSSPQPFTVQKAACEFKRKINLELISVNRPYESVEETMIIWADIDPEFRGDPAAEKAMMDYVQSETKARTRAALLETVGAVRAADQSAKYSSIAIEPALEKVLEFLINDGEDDYKEQARTLFFDTLKESQANLQSI